MKRAIKDFLLIFGLGIPLSLVVTVIVLQVIEFVSPGLVAAPYTYAAPLEQRSPPRDFFTEVALGRVPRYFSALVNGLNSDIDIGTEDIWDGGGIWEGPTEPRLHGFYSSSANDDAGGTGARVLVAVVLDKDGLQQTLTIPLNGTAGFTPTEKLVMVNFMDVISAGSGGINAGTITAVADVDGTTTSQINIGKNATNQSVYRVPFDRRACLESIAVAIVKSNNGTVDAAFLIKINDGVGFFEFGRYGSDTGGVSGSGGQIIPPSCRIIPGAIIKVQSTSTANDSSVSVSYGLIEVQQ